MHKNASFHGCFEIWSLISDWVSVEGEKSGCKTQKNGSYCSPFLSQAMWANNNYSINSGLLTNVTILTNKSIYFVSFGSSSPIPKWLTKGHYRFIHSYCHNMWFFNVLLYLQSSRMVGFMWECLAMHNLRWWVPFFLLIHSFILSFIGKMILSMVCCMYKVAGWWSLCESVLPCII